MKIVRIHNGWIKIDFKEFWMVLKEIWERIEEGVVPFK